MALENKTKKKQRTVNNAYVDIDSVDIPPGNGFVNWIKTTKMQLKERECILLEVIATEVETTINKLMINDRNFLITEDIINNTLKQLYDKIDEWNGINLSRTKSSITRYRDYFCKTKNWWDLKKRKMFGTVFWLNIFKHIQTFVDKGSKEHLNIIKALFNASIRYNNTKVLPLINSGSVLHSSALHRYLFNINNSLQIREWIIENELYGNDNEKCSTLLHKIRSKLYMITANNVESTTNNNGHHEHIANINMDNNIVYGGYHCTSRSVSDIRYTPICLVPVLYETHSNNNRVLRVLLPISNNNHLCTSLGNNGNNDNNDNSAAL